MASNEASLFGPGASSGQFASLDATCQLLLEASIWIYAAADLRELARKGKLSDPSAAERILAGCEADQFFFGAFKENEDALLEHFGAKSTELYLSAIDQLIERMENDQKEMTIVELRAPQLVVFDDDNTKKNECVYSIVLDNLYQRIIVLFRGSVTPHDWLIDAKTSMKEIPNPVAEAKLLVHSGFHEYLFGTKHDQKQCKFDKIMSEVVDLLKEYPEYRICCTGHSLGAALSTLFAFSAAGSSDTTNTPLPVVSINFASPRVGNDNFRDACEKLEKEQKLFILRVTNLMDPVTEMPSSHAGLCGCRCIAHLTFRHVGMELQLKGGSKHAFIHSTSKGYYLKRRWKDFRRDVKETFELIACLCLSKIDYLKCHSCLEYVRRVRDASQELKNVKLAYLWDDRMRRRMNARESICR